MNKIVSCVVLNYNDFDTTVSLISRIKNYDCLNYIVVVDNLSTDDSYSNLLKLESERIIVLSSGKNGGYGFGNNCGLKYAINELKSDYCIVANPDVIFDEDILNPMISFLDNNPDYAVVAPAQSGSKKLAWKKTGVFKDQLFNSLILNKLFNPRYYPDSYFENFVCDVYAVKGCFLMFRSQAVVDFGFYDEEFFLFEEEKIIAYKLEQIGLKSAVLTYISYIHNHSVSIKKSFRKLGKIKSLVLKSNELYLKKYMHVGNIRLFFIKIYHLFCILESMIYELFLIVFSKKEKKNV